MGEYEDFVKAQRVRALDPLTSVDERIDFLGPKIVEALEKVGRVEYALGQLELPEGVAMPKVIEQIPFFYSLAIGQGVMLNEYAPFSGYIKQVSIHWPAGCSALVDIRVGHGTKQFCPNEGFLALDAVTPVYSFSEFVQDHEEIWVEMRNASGFPHGITVVIQLEGVT